MDKKEQENYMRVFATSYRARGKWRLGIVDYMSLTGIYRDWLFYGIETPIHNVAIAIKCPE